MEKTGKKRKRRGKIRDKKTESLANKRTKDTQKTENSEQKSDALKN